MKKQILIQKIQKCNLPKEDKEELINLLNKSDHDGFLKKVLGILRVADIINDIIELIV